MDVRRFSTRHDVAQKNPVGGANPQRVARRARRQGVLSFGYFDQPPVVKNLCTSKEK